MYGGRGERGEVSQLAALPTSVLTLVNAVVLVEEILLVRQKRWQDSLLLAQNPWGFEGS